MRMPIEGLHTETGPGVLEAALHYCEALEAADRAALFKTFTKVLAQRRGLMATFMAKWSQHCPARAAICTSRWRGPTAARRSTTRASPADMSDEMRWFVGGQQALMPELLAMVASTVNSYSRLVPGFWAPTAATWGVENRTCALRVIQGGPKSQRVEYRIAAADINPYLAIAAAIGSGLWGIENQIEPDEPISGNAYDRSCRPSASCRARLSEAAERLAHSSAAQGAVRRALRRAFRRQPRMGGARVPARGHRLGTGALLRDHLMMKTISPVDGRVYVERTAADSRRNRATLRACARGAAAVARACHWRSGPRSWSASAPPSRRAAREIAQRAELADGPADPLRTERDARHARARALHDRHRRQPHSPMWIRARKPGFRRFIRREPLGVVFTVAAWNYPYLIAVNSVVPALLAGNAVILKHSAQTPLCAERFAECFAAAGLAARACSRCCIWSTPIPSG